MCIIVHTHRINYSVSITIENFSSNYLREKCKNCSLNDLCEKFRFSDVIYFDIWRKGKYWWTYSNIYCCATTAYIIYQSSNMRINNVLNIEEYEYTLHFQYRYVCTCVPCDAKSTGCLPKVSP